MKNSVTNELPLTLATAIVAGAIGLSLFGVRLWDGELIEIKLPNRDIAFSKQLFLLIVFVILLIGGIIIRAIYYKLYNRGVAGLLAFLLIFLLTWQVIYIKYVNGFHYHIAPVVDKGQYFQKLEISGSKEFKALMWTSLFVTGATLATLGFRIFKTKRLS